MSFMLLTVTKTRRHLRERLISFGCLAAAVTAIGFVVYAAVTFRAAKLGLIALVLCIPIAILVQRWRLHRALSHFRKAHGANGKDLLIVYTSSPHWQPYIDENWVSRWRDRAVILNRSEPHWQSRSETRLWRRLTGRRNHTPAAIVVPRRGAAQVVRLYRAFQDYKHGKPSMLRSKELELEDALRKSWSGDV
jgi:hypothetical protein